MSGQEKALIGLIIATIGSGLTAALTFQQPGSQLFVILTIISLTLTPLGVYFGVYKTTNAAAPDTTVIAPPVAAPVVIAPTPTATPTTNGSPTP